MGIHDGHRKRIKNNFLSAGIEDKPDIEVLELLLTYAIPRIDVRPIAQTLLENFGTLDGVFKASVESLTEIKHINEHVAVLIKLTGALCEKYKNSAKSSMRLDTFGILKEYLAPRLKNEVNEVFYIVCLDHKLNLLSFIRHSEGTDNAAPVDIRDLTNEVLLSGCTNVILVHNHFSGSPEPSAADIVTTKRISEALSSINVSVIDHVIFASGTFFSLHMESAAINNLKE